ncbi:MAG: hypothetical protein J6M10_01800 [Clostridia bacterium]|nr:hypothetical protein [Clostridia bacterium]
MEQKKRMSASERQTFMHAIAAVEAMENLGGLEKRIGNIKRGNWLYKTGKGIIGKLYEELFKSIPYEQQKSIQRQLPGFRYSLHIQNVNGKDMRNDGLWLSWEALEALSEAIKDRCLMCQKDTTEQRKCRLAKALDELPCIKADENARGCRYFGGLY